MQIQKAYMNYNLNCQPKFLSEKQQTLIVDNYVKIRKDKYYRDQILGWSAFGILILDLLTNHFEQSPIDQITEKVLKIVKKIKKK